MVEALLAVALVAAGLGGKLRAALGKFADKYICWNADLTEVSPAWVRHVGSVLVLARPRTAGTALLLAGSRASRALQSQQHLGQMFLPLTRTDCVAQLVHSVFCSRLSDTWFQS